MSHTLTCCDRCGTEYIMDTECSWCATRDARASKASDEVLKEELKKLAAWCESRAKNLGNIHTTITLVEKKTSKIKPRALKAWGDAYHANPND